MTRNPLAYVELFTRIVGKKEGALVSLGEIEMDIMDVLINSMHLSDRSKKIFRSSVGLDGEALSGYEQERCFGVSPARIKQIEQKCLRKLKHSSRSRFLRALFVQNG